MCLTSLYQWKKKMHETTVKKIPETTVQKIPETLVKKKFPKQW